MTMRIYRSLRPSASGSYLSPSERQYLVLTGVLYNIEYGSGKLLLAAAVETS